MERWEPLKGFEGLYEISNYGQVKSIRRAKVKILKQRDNSKGYPRVNLAGANGRQKDYFVHRLVAEQFIPHDEKLNVVNHLDFNPHNNNVENLEWTTQLENMRYSYRNGRFLRTKEWKNNLRKTNEKKGKAVIGTPIDGGKEIYFICLNDVKTKGFLPSSVCNCCKRKQKTHKNYFWRYATLEEKAEMIK